MFAVWLLKGFAYLTFLGAFVLPVFLLVTMPFFGVTQFVGWLLGGLMLSAVLGTLAFIAEKLNALVDSAH